MTPDGQSPQSRSKPDVQLEDLVAVLWRWKAIIVGGALAAGVIAYGLSSFQQRVYEADVLLLASGPLSVADLTEQNVPPPVSSRLPTLINIVRTRELARSVIEEFGLGAAPLELGASDFLANNLVVAPVNGADVLRVSVRLSDPEVAAAAANRLAELAVEKNDQLATDEAVETRDFMAQLLRDAESRVWDAEQHLLEFDHAAQLAALEAELNAQLADRQALEAARVRASIQEDSLSGRLQAAEAAIQAQPRLIEVQTSIDQEPALMEVLRRLGLERALLDVGLRNESLNPTFAALDLDIAQTGVALAESEARSRAHEQQLAAQMRRISQLEIDVATKQLERSRLFTEVDTARQSASDIRSRFDQARLRVASRTVHLEILDVAEVPTTPIAPRPLRTAALVIIMMGAFLAIAAIGMEYYRRALRPAA